MTTDEHALPNECRSCGSPIGVNTERNVMYMCDKPHNDDKAWCGKCFKNIPCGLGKHGEGCATAVHCQPVGYKG